MQITSSLGLGLFFAAGSLVACSSDGGPLPGAQGGDTGATTSSTTLSSTGSGGTNAGTGSSTMDTTGTTTGASGSTGTSGSTGSGGSGGGSVEDAGTGGGIGGGAVGDGGIKTYFDGTNLDAWIHKPLDSWTIMDMAMYSKGTARGFVYTKDKFTDYRVIFTLRQVSGDHKPTVLVYNMGPDKDAMGGVQFQPPQGGHWDYRPGHNDAGNNYFTSVNSGKAISTAMWARCEILVLATGTARMACCQLSTAGGPCKSLEILAFHDDPKNLSTTGPFAIQIHNGGIHDEYKDITIESNPAVKDLITNK